MYNIKQKKQFIEKLEKLNSKNLLNFFSYTQKLESTDLLSFLSNKLYKDTNKIYWENNKSKLSFIAFGVIDEIEIHNSSDLKKIQQDILSVFGVCIKEIQLLIQNKTLALLGAEKHISRISKNEGVVSVSFSFFPDVSSEREHLARKPDFVFYFKCTGFP